MCKMITPLMAAPLLAILCAGPASAQVLPDPARIQLEHERPPALQKPPLEPLAQWAAVHSNGEARHAAPANEAITDCQAMTRLWRAWRSEDNLPVVDFDKEILLVLVGQGPNIPGVIDLRVVAGNVTGRRYQTLIGGPGFGYRIIKVKREGIRSVFGQPIE
jgi:hypothetical protein